MARHLATCGRRVVGGADRLQEDLPGRHAEREHQRPIPVVRVEPVVAGAEGPREAEPEGFVTGPGDLEVHAALLSECDLAVVEVA